MKYSSSESESFTGQLGWKNDQHDLRVVYDVHDLSSEAPPRDDLPPIFSKLIIDFHGYEM